MLTRSSTALGASHQPGRTLPGVAPGPELPPAGRAGKLACHQGGLDISFVVTYVVTYDEQSGASGHHQRAPSLLGHEIGRGGPFLLGLPHLAAPTTGNATTPPPQRVTTSTAASEAARLHWECRSTLARALHVSESRVHALYLGGLVELRSLMVDDTTQPSERIA